MHLRAEVNPLFAAARLVPGGDDERRAAPAAEIGDIGTPADTLEPDEVEVFVTTIA
jgi:hypothetical protein